MKNTKWQLRILELHKSSKVIDIDDVYTTCSYAKRQAFNKIWNEYSHPSLAGQLIATTQFKIISYNKMMFTCGYYFFGPDKKWYFKYFSHRRTVVFEVFEFSPLR